MSFNQVPFRDLILETKDGDWGKDEEKAGFVPYRVIRGGDFPNVEIGAISKVPTCYLKKSTVVRRTLKAGDLLIETAGGTKKKPTGRVVYISQELLDKFNLPVTCASFARFIRIDEKKVNPKFIFWYLRNMYEKGEMWQHQVQHTGVARFQWTKFADGFMFDLPTRARQNEVVKVLDALQKKIVANLKINQTLESMAQTIFKSWFVDFEPVKAKIATIEAGEDAEGVTRAAMRAISGKTDDELDQMQAGQPENYAQLKTTAELFPSTMQDSELGDVPEGWKVGCIGDIAKAKGGYAYKSKSFIEEGNPVVKIKNIVGNGTVNLEDCQCINGVDADATGRFLLKGGDLLMAMTGATVGKVGLIVTDYKKAFVNQRVAKFESEKFGDKVSWFLFCAFRRDPVFDAVVGAAQGSAQPNISSSGIESTAIVLPSDDFINEFSNRVDSLFRKWMNNFSENLRLSEIRDTLLPKLLSGELEINATK